MTPIDISIPSDGVSLRGTLQLPDAETRPAAALLISGSGPLDRDSNWKRMKVDVMRQVATHLAAAGVASLRYDKRGVGESGGDYRSAGLHDNIADASAALTALRARSEIDPQRIVVIGHSEGALIAAELAADTDLDGVVLLAGAATTGEEVLTWQARQLAPTLPRPVRWIMRLLRQDLVETQTKRLARIKASTDDVIRINFVKLNAKWFREFMAHDPTAGLGAAAVPVLAITGSKDIQVNPADVDAMERLVQTPFVGVVPENITHLLRSEAGPASLRTYKKQVRRPVDSGVLATITEWIATTTAGEPVVPKAETAD